MAHDDPFSPQMLELTALLDRHCDEELTLDDRTELNRLLRLGPEMRRLYAQYVQLHVGLVPGPMQPAFAPARLLESISPSDAPEVLPAVKPQRGSHWLAASSAKVTRHPRIFSAVAAIAFVVFLLAAMAIIRSPQRPIVKTPANDDQPQAAIVAHLLHATDSRWDGDVQYSQGMPIRAGQELRLRSGIVEVAFRGGAIALVQGPAIFVPGAKDAAQIKEGCLVVHVNERAAGFTVNAPGLSVVDLGTEFGVEVDGSGETRVEVFDGVVAVHENRDSQTTNVPAGETFATSPWPEEGASKLRALREQPSFRERVALREANRSRPRTRASEDFVSALAQIEGDVNPLELGPYRDKSLAKSPEITVNGDGTFTMVLDYREEGDWSPAFGWEQADHPASFVSSATGWTWETRFRIDSANAANRGVWEIYLRDDDGGRQVSQRIHFLATGIDRDNQGFGLDAELPFDFTDGFHVVRACVDANNRTSVWIDGILAIDKAPSSTATGPEFARIGQWGGKTRGGAVTIDYIRFDTTGAYAPPSGEPRP